MKKTVPAPPMEPTLAAAKTTAAVKPVSAAKKTAPTPLAEPTLRVAKTTPAKPVSAKPQSGRLGLLEGNQWVYSPAMAIEWPIGPHSV